MPITDFRTIVFDLPQIASKPSYEELIQALTRLKVKPASWGSRIANQPQSDRDRKACARYLTNIISSNLTWLQSDEEREKLWEEGSKCLAERCGRTGRRTVFLPISHSGLLHLPIIDRFCFSFVRLGVHTSLVEWRCQTKVCTRTV